MILALAAAAAAVVVLVALVVVVRRRRSDWWHQIARQHRHAWARFHLLRWWYNRTGPGRY